MNNDSVFDIETCYDNVYHDMKKIERIVKRLESEIPIRLYSGDEEYRDHRVIKFIYECLQMIEVISALAKSDSSKLRVSSAVDDDHLEYKKYPEIREYRDRLVEHREREMRPVGWILARGENKRGNPLERVRESIVKADQQMSEVISHLEKERQELSGNRGRLDQMAVSVSGILEVMAQMADGEEK